MKIKISSQLVVYVFVLGLTLGLVVPSISLAAPIQYSGTGHYYEVVEFSGGIIWADAKEQASNSYYNGLRGHLVTINSWAEHTWIWNTLSWYDKWIGGFQSEPGVWEWVTGEPWSVNAWYQGVQPVTSGIENLIYGYQGRWFAKAGNGIHSGYIVEYESIGIVTKADVLRSIGVLGKGILNALGLQKTFNPKSRAAERVGKIN